jgi:hypothetical protein
MTTKPKKPKAEYISAELSEARAQMLNSMLPEDPANDQLAALLKQAVELYNAAKEAQKAINSLERIKATIKDIWGEGANARTKPWLIDGHIVYVEKVIKGRNGPCAGCPGEMRDTDEYHFKVKRLVRP